MQLVLDGIEDRPYKPAHEVRLFGAGPSSSHEEPTPAEEWSNLTGEQKSAAVLNK